MFRQQLYYTGLKAAVTVSTAIPFVNRRDELGKLRDGLESDDGMFYAVVGPSGSGKSALLDRFQEQCEDDTIYVIRHDIGEPKSDIAFIYRFLETWDQALPGSKWGSIKERVKETNTDILVPAAKVADPVVGASTQIISTILSDALDDEELNNAIDEVDFLLNVLQESSDRRIVVIIDQFDERRLSERVSKGVGRIFREISKDSPDNIIWCVGADHAFSDYDDNMIDNIRIGPLGSNAIEDLIDKTDAEIGEAEAKGRDHNKGTASYITEITNFGGPDLTRDGLVDEIRMRTKGHPFALSLFIQEIQNKDLSYAIQELPRNGRKAQRYLEEQMLDRMDPQEEELLRDICVVEQFDRELAAQMSGNTVSQTRQVLSRLKQQSLIREVQGVSREIIYRCHDLIREHLLNDIINPREQQSRYRAVAVFAVRVHDDIENHNTSGEMGRSEIATNYEQIRLQFNQILSEEKLETAVKSMYDASENLPYNLQQAEIQSGLEYCYSLQESEVLHKKIQSVSNQG